MLVLHLPSAHLPRTNARLVHGLMIPHPHTQGNSDSIYGSHDDHSTFGACCDLLLLFPLFYFDIRQLRPMRTSGVYFADAGVVFFAGADVAAAAARAFRLPSAIK